MNVERIITHNDFDGVVSAALCSAVYGCDRFVFTGPNAIARAEISITMDDVVCDLPYPLECGQWFDHHSGNREAVRLRGIDPDAIPGLFDEQPSCARVILMFFTGRGESLAGHFEETVTEADMIDSFNYRSVEEWREETPGKLVDMSIKAYSATPRDQTKFLDHLTGLVRDLPLPRALEDPVVAARLERYREEERHMVEFIERSVSYLPQDRDRELIVLDFTPHKRPPRVIRNLAYLVQPQALGVVTLNPLFRGGRKTTDFSVSMSLSMNMTGRDHGKDIGEIMRSLNIGDGHVGAAAGTVNCDSKDEMLRAKKRLLGEIWDAWRSMRPEDSVE
ncbi:MAG TPA: hypothetical protein VMX58_07725 [Patescibacteria group bacterium]|nr:hypothetical protein [Patescibacteria group bacterium]